MGRIRLAAPVVHIWFFKAMPSRLGTLLDMKTSSLERVVYFQDYVVIDSGDTPLENARLPFGLKRFRLELEGYRTLYAAGWRRGRYTLDPADSLPEGMVRVQGGEFEVFLPGLEHLKIELPDYLIDATEVTNRQYKRFVDAGGSA